MSDAEELQAEAIFEEWNERTKGGTIKDEGLRCELDYYDDLIGKGHGDPDFHEQIRYIGKDKAVIEHSTLTTTEWDSWFDRDNDARSPLEADLEDIDV